MGVRKIIVVIHNKASSVSFVVVVFTCRRVLPCHLVLNVTPTVCLLFRTPACSFMIRKEKPKVERYKFYRWRMLIPKINLSVWLQSKAILFCFLCTRIPWRAPMDNSERHSSSLPWQVGDHRCVQWCARSCEHVSAGFLYVDGSLLF